LADGDMIVSLDGARITGVDDVIRILDAGRIGEALTVEVVRGGTKHKLAVVPTERASPTVEAVANDVNGP
jgi:S1-C subfamily serine protease